MKTIIETSYGRYIFVISLIVISIIYVYDTSYEEGIQKAKSNLDEYPLLNYQPDRIVKGVIVFLDLDMGAYNKGSLYVKMSDGSKFSLGLGSSNKAYTPDMLISFLEIGDVISKAAGDNLFIVTRYNKKYYFKLGEIINDDAKGRKKSDTH